MFESVIKMFLLWITLAIVGVLFLAGMLHLMSLVKG